MQRMTPLLFRESYDRAKSYVLAWTRILGTTKDPRAPATSEKLVLTEVPATHGQGIVSGRWCHASVVICRSVLPASFE